MRKSLLYSLSRQVSLMPTHLGNDTVVPFLMTKILEVAVGQQMTFTATFLSM